MWQKGQDHDGLLDGLGKVTIPPLPKIRYGPSALIDVIGKFSGGEPWMYHWSAPSDGTKTGPRERIGDHPYTAAEVAICPICQEAKD